MLSAPFEQMRLPSLLVLMLAAGCTDSLTIEGNLLNLAAAAEVRSADASWLLEAGGFRIDDVSGDSLRLVFAGGESGEGVMTISGLPSRGRVALEDVWIADGVAFPTRIDSPDNDVLTVNGLRMGGAALVDGDQEITGTVLAISSEDGTLLLRPVDDELPDVGVFLGTGTVLQTAAGEPVDFGQLGFGDTLVVSGVGASGYVMSQAIVSPGGSMQPSGDQLPLPEIDTGPPDEREDENGGGGNGGDRDEDDDRGRDNGGNRGRGRPAFTPGRRSELAPGHVPLPDRSAPGSFSYLPASSSRRFS